MTAIKIFWACVTIFLFSIPVTLGYLSSVRISTSPTIQYNYRIGANVSNLTVYYTFLDDRLSIPQDWMGQIRRNNAVNVSMPQTLAHWTFDYDREQRPPVVTGSDRYVPNQTATSYSYVGTWFSAGATEARDNNWATFSETTNGGGPARLYEFYAKPTGYSGATWGIKTGIGGVSIQNLTITGACLTYNASSIMFRINSSEIPAFSGRVGLACKAGPTTWTTLWDSGVGGDGTDFVYEDTLYWKFSPGTSAETLGVNESSITGGNFYGYRKNFFDNTVAYIPFDMSNTTHYMNLATNQSIHGAITSTTKNYSVCHKGACGSFLQAASKLNVGSNSNGDHLRNSTACAWLYVNNCAGGSSRVLEKGTGGGGGYRRFYVDSCPASIAHIGTTLDTSGVDMYYSTSNGFSFKSWTHVCAVIYNTSTGFKSRIYINGTESTYSSSITGTGTLTDDAAGNWYVGNSGDGANPFNGNIDELYLFNKSLSQPEINRLYTDSCHSGFCYDFDGVNDYVNTSFADLSNAHNWTVSAWIYPRSLDDTEEHIAELQGTQFYRIGANLSYKEGAGAYTANVLTPNVWQHVAVTRTTAGVSLYKDGNAVTTYGTTALTSDPTSLAFIGIIYNGSTSYAFNGTIDDVEIFNRSLTAAQVRMLYQGALVRPSGFLNGSWTGNITVRNYTKRTEQRTTTGVNRSLIYDSVLKVLVEDDLGASLSHWTSNTSNKNVTERRKIYTTTTQAVFNLSHGNTNISVNKTLYSSAKTTMPIWDVFHTYTFTLAPIINFTLWNEVTDKPFNPENTTYARLWYDNTSVYTDMKATPWVQIARNEVSKLRLELAYYTSSIIVSRYINPSLIQNTTEKFKICASYNRTFYEQFIRSAYVEPVGLRNQYVHCWVALDYTRYAGEDVYQLHAWTTDTNYDVYTYDDGEQVYLAAFDGSVASYINLDQLIYNLASTTQSILGEGLHYHKLFNSSSIDSQTFVFTYRNFIERPTHMNFTIVQANGSTLLFRNSFSNTSNWTLLWTYASYNLTNTTPLTATLRYLVGGVERSIVQVFTINNDRPYLNAKVAFAISFMLMIFGLSLFAARYALSIFGLFIVLASLTFCAFSPQLWYIIMLETLETICLIYIGIVMWTQHYQAVV